jgi:hypothetical protein
MSESAASNHAGPYRALDEIKHLVREFEASTLPHSAWTHQAHLTVALWYLTQCPEVEAISRMRDGIQRLNHAHGIPTTKERGYHETLTLFWLKLVGQDAANAAGVSLVEMANEVVHRYTNSRLPLEYYSHDLLMSWEARLRWVEPDLKPIV